jgi:hypothetical protein
MKYYLDIWNAVDSKCIVPGFSSQGALVVADTPIPIPNVGEVLDFRGDKWRVERRVYFYADEGEPGYEPAIKLIFIARKCHSVPERCDYRKQEVSQCPRPNPTLIYEMILFLESGRCCLAGRLE